MSVTDVRPEQTRTAGGAAPIEGGVIRDARRRQRRRRAIGAALTGVVAAGVLVLAFGGGNGRLGGHARLPAREPALRLTFARGVPYVNGQPFPLVVSPDLRAGAVGLCVLYNGEGSCGAYPGPGVPLYDLGFSPEVRVGPQGEIDFELVGPQVAAVRVQRLGTFTPITLPWLPPGERVVAFYRPAGSLGTVLPAGSDTRILLGFGYGGSHPTPVIVSPLDRGGHALVTGPQTGNGFRLANRYWQPPDTPPANGRCALASRTPGASVQWGQVATTIAPDSAASTGEFLTCLRTWFNAPGGAFQAAVLLNARSPGRAPGLLWGAVPVPGHPGIVEIKARKYVRPHSRPQFTASDFARVARQRGQAFARELAARVAHLQAQPIIIQPLTVARRVGPAWILVQYGGALASDIRLLNHLELTHFRYR